MYAAYGAATPGPAGPYRTAGGGPPAAYGYGDYQEQQPLAYPAKPSPFFRGQRKTLNFIMVIANLFVPWIIFVALMGIEGFRIHYSAIGLCHVLDAILLILVIGFGVLALNAWRKQQGEGLQDPTWLGILFVSSLIAWIVGCAVGHGIYATCLFPYYEVNALNMYNTVDPALYGGQQLMDAGRITFTPGTHLDFKHSMGFRNLDTYCVSPIVSGDPSAANASEAPSYDFWAVGLNCCSGHAADFQCGEYNNPSAKSGLRLMRDDQRPYFRLAVQQAEAAYNIKAAHPIFVYWMQDPMTEINAYQDDGYRFFLLGLFSYFAFQLFVVVVSTIVISKFGA